MLVTVLNSIIYSIFIIVTAVIGWNAFSNISQAPNLGALLGKPSAFVLIAIGVLFFFLLSSAFVRFSRAHKLKERCAANKLFLIIAFGILLFGQITLILLVKESTFMYDPYRVFDEALRMGGSSPATVSASAMQGYYSIYPNNIPFTIVVYGLLKIGSLFGLKDAGLMVMLQIINALCIDTAIYLTYLALYRHGRREAAVLSIFLCLVSPTMYLWPQFPYTSTFSMPFIMGALLLFLEMIHPYEPIAPDGTITPAKEGKDLTYLIRAVLLGIVLVVGFKLRATVVISGIAMVIVLLLYLLHMITDKKQPVPLKKVAKPFAAAILSIVITGSLCGAIQSRYAPFDTTDTAFPVVSWLAVGLEGDGMFNTTDYYDTLNAPTAQEKKAVNMEKIRTRLSGLGVGGYIDLMGRKMIRTWSDGTDDYASYINQYENAGKLHSYLFEDQRDFLVLLMQIERAFLFCLAFFGAVRALYLGIRNHLMIKKQTQAKVHMTLVPFGGSGTFSKHWLLTVLLVLNFLGGTFFHILWETGELYSLCFTMLLYALAAEHFVSYVQSSENDKEVDFSVRFHTLIKVLPILLMVITMISLLTGRTYFTKDVVRRHSTVISQKTYTSSETPGLLTGEKLTQDFVSDKPFNRVSLRAKNSIPEGRDSEYHITLTSEDGRLLMDQTVTGGDILDYDYFYLGLAEEEAPDKETRYTITVDAIRGTETDSVVFLQYETGNHDAYRYGSLTYYPASGEPAALSMDDLNFNVYRSFDGTVMSSSTYFLISLLILLAESALIIVPGIKSRKRNRNVY